MTYKTTGTLKEIGAKVGDVMEAGWGRKFEVTDFDLEQRGSDKYTIISLANPTGPVRTVTRKEIVPGVYGAVEVEGRVNGVAIKMKEAFFCSEPSSVADLTDAIATLTEIRDAL